MSMKGWVVNKVNRLFTRVDLPPRPSPLGRAVMRQAEEQRTRTVAHDAQLRAQQLGAYAPLVAAMREELENFVASHVRMHLAIAEHDRYLLTSVEVEPASDDARDLLQRFIREFKPEQIKLYLAKEVIGRLPNASAIDLSHFGGLNLPPGHGDADDAYGELVAELRRTEPRPGQRPYKVSLKGRWSELDNATRRIEKARGFEAPRTPLAGQALDVEIEDANGSRHVTLPSVVPGRRYSIGSGEGCDVVVNGEYASRRHCEIWLDRGAWWVTDSGSTNGLRVEAANKVLGRSGAHAGRGEGGQLVIEVVAGARIVLSAVAAGTAAQYPRLSLRASTRPAVPSTPLAPSVQVPGTPSTPIVVARRRSSGMVLTVRMASGERAVELPAGPIPFRVGRSRSQSLVIDWAHEDVSGHHVDIADIDDGGAQVLVHGDNGVTVAGVAHPSGTKFRWNVGDTLVLGGAVDGGTECTLVLSRRE